jgi:outer membrane protein TolC
LIRQSSTSLRSALARIAQAKARSRQAGAGWLPTVDAGAEVRRQLIRGRRTDFITGQRELIPDPATTFAARAELRVPLFAPRAWYDDDTAEQAIDVSRLDEAEIKRLVVAEAADAIVVTITQERLAEVSRVSLKSALSTVNLNKRRAALGASSTLDVLRAEQEVQLARAQVVSADEALVRAREALGIALGSSEDYGVTPDVKLDSLAQDARASCRTESNILTRPDVKAAAAKVTLAEREIGAVDWSYWPRVDASSAVTWAPRDFSENGRRVSWDIRGTLSWTLYDGGLRYGQKDEAAANVRLARETLTDTRRRAELEVTQAMRSVKVAQANLEVSTRAREIAVETARLARVAYMNGSGTSFDLVDTARRQREAELDLTIKEFQVLRAGIAALLSLASCDV